MGVCGGVPMYHGDEVPVCVRVPMCHGDEVAVWVWVGVPMCHGDEVAVWVWVGVPMCHGDEVPVYGGGVGVPCAMVMRSLCVCVCVWVGMPVCHGDVMLSCFQQDVEEKITGVLCFVGGGWMVDQPNPDVSVCVYMCVGWCVCV